MAENYKLTSPSGTTFFAKVAFQPRLTMYSTRETGQWQADKALNVADIVMPEHGPYYDWDIERLPDTTI